MTKRWFSVLPIVALAGCMSLIPYGGTFRFDGPANVNEQQFIKEFYQCAKTNTTTVASGLLTNMGEITARNRFPPAA